AAPARLPRPPQRLLGVAPRRSRRPDRILGRCRHRAVLRRSGERALSSHVGARGVRAKHVARGPGCPTARANVLKMALLSNGWQAMKPLGRVFRDRRDAGMRRWVCLHVLHAIALVMLALASPATANDGDPATLRIGGDANYPP